MLHRWQVTEWKRSIGGVVVTGENKYWERNLSHCHFVYQKSKLNRPRTEPVSPRTGTKLLHDLFSGWFITWWTSRWLAG